MPIISGGIFGFNEIKMGTALVNALIRKTDRTNWPRTWKICHPDPTVIERITQGVKEDQAAGEGRSDQGVSDLPRSANAMAEFLEENSVSGWPVIKRTRTVKGKKR